MVGHERSPRDSPGSAAPRVSIPGQQRAATIINPAPATLFSGFPDSSSAASFDSRDFVFDLAPEKEGTTLAGCFVLFPKLGLAPDRVEIRREQNDGEKHDLRFISAARCAWIYGLSAALPVNQRGEAPFVGC